MRARCVCISLASRSSNCDEVGARESSPATLCNPDGAGGADGDTICKGSAPLRMDTGGSCRSCGQSATQQAR